MTSSQEVNVQVRHGLPSVRAVVHHDPKTLRQAFVVGDFTGHEEQMPEEGCVLLVRFADTRDWLSWYYQKVDGSLRINVAQHDALIVLMNEVPGDFAIYYFAEKSFLRHGGLDEQQGKGFGWRRFLESCFFNEGNHFLILGRASLCPALGRRAKALPQAGDYKQTARFGFQWRKLG